jgi:septal ring factor EnvC (AmiA/AmiB activator)
MKHRFIPLLAFLSAVIIARADSFKALDHQLAELSKRINGDVESHALTQPDADELNRDIARVQNVEQSEPTLTKATRRDLKEQVEKIKKSLDLKEAQAKALASSSPAP